MPYADTGSVGQTVFGVSWLNNQHLFTHSHFNREYLAHNAAPAPPNGRASQA
jgi:hypothetical protein